MAILRTRLLDAGIDLVGQGGYAGVTPARVARKAGVRVATYQEEFPTRASWIAASYERLFERRLAQYREIAGTVPSGNIDPDVTLAAVLRTVLDGDDVDPLFAATFDFFFLGRNDAALSRRLLSIRTRWEARIDAITPSLFPATTSAATRDLVLTHVVALGSTAVSNGLANFDPRPIDLPILRAALVA